MKFMYNNFLGMFLIGIDIFYLVLVLQISDMGV